MPLVERVAGGHRAVGLGLEVLEALALLVQPLLVFLRRGGNTWRIPQANDTDLLLLFPHLLPFLRLVRRQGGEVRLGLVPEPFLSVSEE